MIQIHLFEKLDEQYHPNEVQHAKKITKKNVDSYAICLFTGSVLLILFDRLINVPLELVSHIYRWPWSYSNIQWDEDIYRLFAIDKSLAKKYFR